MHLDLCADCGRNTAPGTRLFSDRRRLPAEDDRPPAVLCSDCHEATTQRAGRQLRDRELRSRLEGGSAVGMIYGPI